MQQGFSRPVRLHQSRIAYGCINRVALVSGEANRNAGHAGIGLGLPGSACECTKMSACNGVALAEKFWSPVECVPFKDRGEMKLTLCTDKYLLKQHD